LSGPRRLGTTVSKLSLLSVVVKDEGDTHESIDTARFTRVDALEDEVIELLVLLPSCIVAPWLLDPFPVMRFLIRDTRIDCSVEETIINIFL